SKFVESHLTIAHDDGEQVVEVVGDAARELADGFHLLGLAVLFFELLAFGDIGPRTYGFERFTGGVAQQADLAADPAKAAISVLKTILMGGESFVDEILMRRGDDGWDIVGMNVLHPSVGAVSFGYVVAEHVEDVVAHPGVAANLVILDREREKHGRA